MATKWVNVTGGQPLLTDFNTTQGLGSPLCVNGTNGEAFVLVNNVMVPVGGLAQVTSTTDLANVPTSEGIVWLNNGAASGLFVWTPGNQSAFVTADTAKGIYVAPASDTTGASGAWIRYYLVDWDIRWFGAVPNDQSNAGTDALGAINAFLALAAVVGKSRTNDATFNGLIRCDFPGYYFCSALINLKTPVHLRGFGTGMGGVVGGSRIRFPAGVAGIVVNGPDTTGYTVAQVTATTGASGSIIEGLPLWCGDGTRPAAGTAHGILVRARCSIINPYISGFAGTGIAIYADLGANPFFGNADGTHIRGGRVQNCGVHGIHLKGGDANACDITGVDTFGNGQWGIFDESFLGVTVLAGQFAGNGAAAYVDYPAAGQTYAVVIGQESGASTTQPGTNSSIWCPIPGATNIGRTWVSGMTVISGGSFGSTSTSTFIQPYTELGQVAQVGNSSIVINGLISNGCLLGPQVKSSFGKVSLEGGLSTTYPSFVTNYLRLDGNVAWPGGATNLYGFAYHNSADGLVVYGGGSTSDFRILDQNGNGVFKVPAGTTEGHFEGHVYLSKSNELRWDDANASLVVVDNPTALPANTNVMVFRTFEANFAWTNASNVLMASLVNGGGFDLHTGAYKFNGTQVVTSRKTGWSADTGTAKRTANATYSGTAEGSYTQATIQTLMNAVRDLSQTVKALKDDLIAHGLIGT